MKYYMWYIKCFSVYCALAKAIAETFEILAKSIGILFVYIINFHCNLLGEFLTL